MEKKIGEYMRRNRRSGMNRGGFMRAVGAGAAGMAGAAMMGSGATMAHHPPPPGAHLLEDIQLRGKIRIGLAPEEFPGLVKFKGAKPVGLDTDLGRALAAAIFNVDNPKIIDKYIDWVVPAGWDERFEDLREGRADVSFSLATYTTTRDSTLGVDFAVPSYYDGQQIWVQDGINNVGEITKLGYIAATTGASVAPTLGIPIQSFETSEDMVAAYIQGPPEGIDAMITDASGNISNDIANNLGGYHLPEVYSKEFLTPCVAEHQPELMDVLREVMHTLFEAERRGVTKATVTTDFGSGLGPKLGLEPTWAYSAVKMNGNYGEIFEKNLPEDSWYFEPETKDRGLNNLWTKGGLHYQRAYR
jgi:general L-amino acid transport system substrate-binding protein